MKRGSILWHVCALTLVTLAVSAANDKNFDLDSVTQAAERGEVDAQLELADHYDSGNGVRRDLKKAEQWYRAAAEQGDASAQNAVGSIVQERQRYSEALGWYERAAAQGYPQGINNLAYMHDLGLGTPQDREKAFELYQQAAERGWAEAMWNVANMYALGQVGPKDNFQACVWTYRADQYAVEVEQQLRQFVRAGINQISSTMSPEELTRCEQVATDWHPSPGTSATKTVEPT